MASSELLIAVGTVGGGGVFFTMLVADREEKDARKFRSGSISWGRMTTDAAMTSAVKGFILVKVRGVKITSTADENWRLDR